MENDLVQGCIEIVELDTSANELSVLDILDCAANCFSAVGTIGATIVSLVLAYGGRYKKISPSATASFRAVPTRQLEAIEIKLHNKSSHKIIIDELSLEFSYSTSTRSYKNVFPLLKESLQYIGEDDRVCPAKSPLYVDPQTICRFKFNCENSEMGESILRLSNESKTALIRIEVKDKAGRSSRGRWEKIK